MPRSPQTNIDPGFWDRLRQELKSYMVSTGLKQKTLAPKLGIDPTTLNNFLNEQSDTLGGLAVALACTLVDLVCDGTNIGRIVRTKHSEKRVDRTPEPQLVLEFDGAFESKRESKYATIVLRKTASKSALHLSIKKVG